MKAGTYAVEVECRVQAQSHRVDGGYNWELDITDSSSGRVIGQLCLPEFEIARMLTNEAPLCGVMNFFGAGFVGMRREVSREWVPMPKGLPSRWKDPEMYRKRLRQAEEIQAKKISDEVGLPVECHYKWDTRDGVKKVDGKEMVECVIYTYHSTTNEERREAQIERHEYRGAPIREGLTKLWKSMLERF